MAMVMREQFARRRLKPGQGRCRGVALLVRSSCPAFRIGSLGPQTSKRRLGDGGRTGSLALDVEQTQPFCLSFCLFQSGRKFSHQCAALGAPTGGPPCLGQTGAQSAKRDG